MNSIILSDLKGRSFLIGEYIDKGSFSKVYALHCRATNEVFAGKFINKAKLQRYGISNKVQDEISIHQRLRHSNIVQFVTYIERDCYIIIVMEYCSKYSMVNVLHSLKTLKVSEAKYFMSQIVGAVEYLHSNHIVHRDLKLGNLFINSQLEIKLGDFGLAVVVEYEGQKRFSRCGTPNYLAPEVINGTGHSYEVDIWALGCILYTMLEGTPPFQGQNTANTYNNILMHKFDMSSKISDDARSFIANSLHMDSRYRPTVFQLVASDFLTSPHPRPEPPRIHVKEQILKSADNTKSPVAKTPDFPPANNFGIWNNHIYFLSRLRKLLSNVQNWKESEVDEFLSENILLKPVIWVNSWIDYTNSFGFAYQLNNSNVGMLFNDNTRMLLQNNNHYLHYTMYDGNTDSFKLDSIPFVLRKKFQVLVTCGEYMSESLLKAHNGTIDSDVDSVSTEVFQWANGEGEIAMFLTNGSVQVNFAADHTKYILCGFTKTVTVIESADCMKTLKIEGLKTFGCNVNLKTKLAVILTVIDNFLTKANDYN